MGYQYGPKIYNQNSLLNGRYILNIKIMKNKCIIIINGRYNT